MITRLDVHSSSLAFGRGHPLHTIYIYMHTADEPMVATEVVETAICCLLEICSAICREDGVGKPTIRSKGDTFKYVIEHNTLSDVMLYVCREGLPKHLTPWLDWFADNIACALTNLGGESMDATRKTFTYHAALLVAFDRLFELVETGKL